MRRRASYQRWTTGPPRVAVNPIEIPRSACTGVHAPTTSTTSAANVHAMIASCSTAARFPVSDSSGPASDGSDSRHIGRSAQVVRAPYPGPVDPERPEPEPEPEYRNASFTFEGQMERLQHWVVGVNRRGGSDKRLVQIAVITMLVLLFLAYFSGIFWGLFL